MSKDLGPPRPGSAAAAALDKLEERRRQTDETIHKLRRRASGEIDEMDEAPAAPKPDETHDHEDMGLFLANLTSVQHLENNAVKVREHAEAELRHALNEYSNLAEIARKHRQTALDEALASEASLTGLIALHYAGAFDSRDRRIEELQKQLAQKSVMSDFEALLAANALAYQLAVENPGDADVMQTLADSVAAVDNAVKRCTAGLVVVSRTVPLW